MKYHADIHHRRWVCVFVGADLRVCPVNRAKTIQGAHIGAPLQKRMLYIQG